MPPPPPPALSIPFVLLRFSAPLKFPHRRTIHTKNLDRARWTILSAVVVVVLVTLHQHAHALG